MRFSILFLFLCINLCAELKLPDLLEFRDGSKVKSIADWQQRRLEIFTLFQNHVYGVNPVGKPGDISFTVIKQDKSAMEGKATLKVVDISFSGPGGKHKFKANFFIPNNVKKAPVFLLVSHRSAVENLDVTRQNRTEFWPAEEIVRRGFCAASFYTWDIDADKYDGFKGGVHEIFDQGRNDQSWGTISAWAWGASRVMDYIETDSSLDESKVAVVGHSRGGKTALWAGASDQRFAMAVSNNSGCSGAALARRKKGESIAKITKNFKHLFCGKYSTYSNNEDKLPVDQHMLVALMVPRLVYISSSSKDAWADPEGEYLAGVHASKVYELHGLQGLVSQSFTFPTGTFHEGNIGYHIKEAKHSMNLIDWNLFMDFADRHMK